MVLRRACATALYTIVATFWLVGSLAWAQDVWLEWETTWIECRSFSDCNQADGGASYMWLRGDELRMDDGTYGFLIRLSGPYAGFTMLDHGARTAHFLPMAAVRLGESMVNAIGTSRQPDSDWLSTIVEKGLMPCASCEHTIEVIRDGVAEVMTVSPRMVEWSTAAAATLPLELAAEMNEQSLPPEYKDMIVMYSTTRGWSLVDERIPGREQLAAFFAALSEATDGNRHYFQTLTEGLTAGMSRVLMDGMPVSSTSMTQMHMLLGGPLESLGPMLEGMFAGMMPLPTTSMHRLVAVSLDPIINEYDVFFYGGMPDDYTVEELVSLPTLR